MKYGFDKFNTAYQRKIFGELDAIAATEPAEDAGPDAIMEYALRLYDKYGTCRSPFTTLQRALDEPRADLRRQYERLVRAGSPLQYLVRAVLVDNTDSIVAARVQDGRRVTRLEELQEAERHENEMPERWRRELWYRLGMAYACGDESTRSTVKAQEYFEKGLSAGDERCHEHLERMVREYGTDRSGRVREPLGQRLRSALSLRVKESEVHSSSYGVFRLTCLLVGLAAAAYIGYRCFTTDFDWQSLVNWNMMTSPLSSVLAAVVWVMYIPHWISFRIKSYKVDTETGRKTPNRNVVDSAYEWVFPFFANLILIPFVITVVIFYIIMGLFSAVAAVMPVLAAVVGVVITVSIYRLSGKLRAYKIRKGVTMLLMALYVALVVWLGTLL